MWHGQNVHMTNLRRGEHMKIGIDDIKIPKYFCPPNPEKYMTKLNNFQNGGTLSPIIVDNNLNLVDGYISYMIYKYIGRMVVEVYYDDELPVIYIEGTHLKSNNKRYTWYVPRKLSKKFIKKVHVGDIVRCRANNKTVPVIVRNIYMKNEKDHKMAPVVGF